ncbi:MAG: hypothetical protein DRJ28_00960 [Actinobacteria bacterium]|nr:MAG: hypothetical protein DRJ28_00960 [Actinomycetota bacterium]
MLHPGTEESDGAGLVGAAHDLIIARIAEALGERSDLIAMATTLTLSVLSPDVPIEVAHVGGSRAYLALDPQRSRLRSGRWPDRCRRDPGAASTKQPTIYNRGSS